MALPCWLSAGAEVGTADEEAAQSARLHQRSDGEKHAVDAPIMTAAAGCCAVIARAGWAVIGVVEFMVG